MAKKKLVTQYKCSNCNYVNPGWLGHCPQCGSWSTFEECLIDENSTAASFTGSAVTQIIKPVPLSSITAQQNSRISTGIKEFDRVLGGGAMKRSAILLGGEPGIGKSTLMLQATSSVRDTLTKQGSTSSILYISGEESAGQIKSRADRLKLDVKNIEILCTMRLEDIKEALTSLNPVFVIIDSIQTVYSVEAGVVPGTINQLKYCANELIGWVKERDSILIMAAHITKEGAIAGPKSLEHMVDTVVSFERNSDDVRFLRATKNRFGSVDELGIFSMGEDGLTGISDTSTIFLTKREEATPAGISNTCVFEGSRAFLVEIQALTIPAKSSLSRVYSENIDSARVARIAAVLEKRTGLRFSDQDIYINVAGGIRLNESSIDAALASALYSARTDLQIPDNNVFMGELSLAGEIRPVARLKQRIKTSREMGFTNIYCPENEADTTLIKDIKQLVKTVFAPKK